MVDPNDYPYFVCYFFLCLSLGILYIRIKSDEGTIITTKEFQLFQSSFITGYSLVMLCELIVNASFYHIFLSLNLTLPQITKLYLTTLISSTVTHILTEIVDIGARKDKCVLSTILYAVSMFSIFFGSHGHFEMLLLSRIIYGIASALQHVAFESYGIHEHSSRGFPEDWLGQTFALLTHTMALMTALSGILGTIASSIGRLGCVGLTTCLFSITAVYLIVAWEKDVNTPRFMISGFLFNFNSVLNTMKSNKQMFLVIIISSLFETAITIFTFYWAPWLTDLLTEKDITVPYEIIFASFMICSMIGNYLFQLFISKSQLIGVDTTFQAVLLLSSVAYFLGAIVENPLFAYGMSVIVQIAVGMYWPCIGYFRGRVIVPELRNNAMIVPK
jgi:MFS family permease